VFSEQWLEEAGEYEIRVGASFRDIRLSGIVVRDGDRFDSPYSAREYLHYFSGDVASLPDGEFAALLGQQLPAADWDRAAPRKENDMEAKRASSFISWKESHAGLWQFVLFTLMSGITTLVDLGTFALLNFWILAPYRATPFLWGPFHYAVESGGVTAFGAFAISFAVSQTFNFFLQRKTTFKANNNAGLSATLYAIMVIGVYVIQLFLPTLLRAPLVALIGSTLGDLAMKLVNMTVSMLIQFPLNKYVIMRNR